MLTEAAYLNGPLRLFFFKNKKTSRGARIKMEKIESVKLLSNINFPSLMHIHCFGEELLKHEGGGWRLKNESNMDAIFTESFIISKPKWFEVIKKERFQIDTSNLLCNGNLKVINTSGNITTKSLYTIEELERMAIAGRVGSEEQMEYRRMYDVTTFYMEQLAKKLNNGWVYDDDGAAKILIITYTNGRSLQKDLNLVPIPFHGVAGPKFKPELKIDDIMDLIEPVMYENYKKILTNPY